MLKIILKGSEVIVHYFICCHGCDGVFIKKPENTFGFRQIPRDIVNKYLVDYALIIHGDRQVISKRGICFWHCCHEIGYCYTSWRLHYSEKFSLCDRVLGCYCVNHHIHFLRPIKIPFQQGAFMLIFYQINKLMQY